MSRPIGRRASLLVASSTAGVLLLDISKANVALPSIATSLDAGPTTLQLVSAGYVVAFGLALVPAGRSGDAGRRRALTLWGLAGYVVASLVCGLATTGWVLVAGRLALGIAAGILMPQVMGLIQHLFDGPDRARAFGAYGMVIAVATAVGPAIGGLLVTLGGDDGGWRWVFLMNVPVGVALFVLSLASVPPQPAGAVERPAQDPIGLLLLGAVVVLTLGPIVTTTGRPGDDPIRWWLLVPAAVAAIGLWRWERRLVARGGAPLVDPLLWSTPSYRSGLVVASLWLGCVPGLMVALVLYLQLGLGLSPLLAALVLLPAAVTSAAGSWWAGRHLDRLGRDVTVLGLAIGGVGIAITPVLAIHLPTTAAIWSIAAAELLVGLGSGLIIAPNHVLMLADVPSSRGSIASSVGHLGQRFGNSTGIAAASAAFFAVVVGTGGEIVGADRATYASGLVAAYLVCGAFLGLTLITALRDRHRRREASISVLPPPRSTQPGSSVPQPARGMSVRRR